MTLLALRYSPPGWNGFVFTSFQKKKGPGIAKKALSSTEKMKRMFAFSRRAARETLGIAEREGGGALVVKN
jgi:hypothetical protein